VIVTFATSDAKFGSVLAGAYTTLIVQLLAIPLPDSVVPHVPGSVPDRLKSALPVKVMARLLRVGLFAGLVIVSGKTFVVPSTTCPNTVVNGATVSAATPLRVTGTVCEIPGAATRTVSTPAFAPAVVGLNAK